MKIVFFDEFKLGVLKGDSVVDVSRVVQDIPSLGPQDVIRGVIERFAEFRPRLEAAAAQGSGAPLDRVKIRPPLPKPTNVVDGSARGLLPAGNTFYQMKSRDTFAPLGPYLVTADEIADPHQRQIKLSVNGTLKQNFNTNDMAHKIPRCIEWVTSIHTLEPGDVLATGTNHRGLSGLQDGDAVEVETEGLGKLRFNIRDALKRTWDRETRLDRQQKGQEGTTPQLSGKHAVVRAGGQHVARLQR